MDPIKVDFTGGQGGENGKKKNKTVILYPKNAAVKNLIAVILALVGGSVAYYFMLPAFNIKAMEMYEFFAVVIGIYVAALYVLSGAFKEPEYTGYVKKMSIVPLVVAVVVAVVVGIGFVASSVFFRADSYSKIMTVDESKSFASDIQEVDFSAVPVLDDAAAATLAKRTLGDLASIGKVSQFEVATEFTQINYGNKPVKLTTLMYGDVFKWLKNTSTGLPGYIVVDMVTQKAELVMLEEGKYIRYSSHEYFNRNVARHLRFNYPTYLLGTSTFEIDEAGNPYWVCPVLDKTIGLFGGTDVIGAILMDAVTGECKEYTIEEIKADASLQWLDGIYSPELLVEQYNYYGRYSNGFWNSIIGQTGVKNVTEGSNYLAINDDVYLYTGVTSAGSDEAIIGFVLVNMRTKDANFYEISGAKEYSAANSAQGAVQNYKYRATFPLLLNINGQPTYFMSLKDDSSLVKMYAMVNVEQYQVVVTGTTIAECTENYIAKLKENGININVDIEDIEDIENSIQNGEDVTDEAETETVEGEIADIRTAVIGGDSYYYIRLKESKVYYCVKAGDNETVVILNKGDKVKITAEKSDKQIIDATKLSAE